MKNIIRVEEFLLFALSIYGLYYLDVQWWLYLLLFLGPDISMIGYDAGNRVGAFSYNLFHHKGIAALLFIGGMSCSNSYLIIAGIIVFGHSSMDRAIGYGLKTDKGFKFTHLGIIGDKK